MSLLFDKTRSLTGPPRALLCAEARLERKTEERGRGREWEGEGEREKETERGGEKEKYRHTVSVCVSDR